MVFGEYQLRVLLFHDIPISTVDRFAEKIDFFRSRWNFLTPIEFERIISGEVQLTDDSILLTFDDGFKSNKIIADEILKPRDIQSIFFIVPGFVDLVQRSDIDDYLVSNFRLHYLSEDARRELSPMTWDDIRSLILDGHSIGAHSMTHADLSGIGGCSLEYEILNCGDVIERKTGAKVNHFAYSFGGLVNFCPEALVLAAQKYQFIHTGIRGNNVQSGRSRFMIWRESMDIFDPISLSAALANGIADFQYMNPRKVFSGWVDLLSERI